jgi:formate/nitrite transporter FocA (FNT family)
LRETGAAAHTGAWTWVAIVGFAFFGVGIVNQFALRATFLHKEWPIKPALANTLLTMGAIFIVVGLVLRAR